MEVRRSLPLNKILIISMILLVLLPLAGCGSMQSKYSQAEQVDTVDAWRQFLELYEGREEASGLVKEARRRYQIAREKRIREILNTHPGWSLAVANAIVDHKIFEGMTGEQVIPSIGLPDQIVEKSDISPYEEWFYRDRYRLQFARPEGGYERKGLILTKIYRQQPDNRSRKTSSRSEMAMRAKALAQEGQILYVRTENAYLRATPTTKSDNIIEMLPRETAVTVLRGEEGWYLVELKDGRIGWMGASVLAPKK